MQVLTFQPKLLEAQQILSKRSYFSFSSLPGYADAQIFKYFLENNKYPEKKQLPNLYHWYVIMRQFSVNSLDQWIKDRLYCDDQSERWTESFFAIFKKNQSSSLQKINSQSTVDLKARGKCYNPQNHMKKPYNSANLLSNQRAQFAMTVKLNSVNNLQNLTNKLYELKLKIKQLRFNKIQKSAFIRFIASQVITKGYQEQIIEWEDVKTVQITQKKNQEVTTSKPQLSLVVSV